MNTPSNGGKFSLDVCVLLFYMQSFSQSKDYLAAQKKVSAIQYRFGNVKMSRTLVHGNGGNERNRGRRQAMKCERETQYSGHTDGLAKTRAYSPPKADTLRNSG